MRQAGRCCSTRQPCTSAIPLSTANRLHHRLIIPISRPHCKGVSQNKAVRKHWFYQRGVENEGSAPCFIFPAEARRAAGTVLPWGCWKYTMIYVYWGVNQVGWNDELEAPMYGYDPESNYNPGFGILPIEERSLAFAIQTGEDQYQPVPVSGLTVSEGAHLKAIPEEQIAEDSKEFAPYMCLLTVDDFDKRYTLSYTDGEDTYELTFDSFTFGARFYSKPELDNGNIINGVPYSVMGEDPVVYLGAKPDPEWQGSRRIASVALAGEDKDDFTLEKVDQGFWRITLKNSVKREFNHHLMVQIQWEHEEGEGRWVKDDGLDEQHLGFWPEEAMVYADQNLLAEGQNFVELEGLEYAFPQGLELTEGETKTIYPYIARTIGEGEEERWVLQPVADFELAATDTGAVALSDMTGHRSMEVSAVKAGSAELLYIFPKFTIYDKNGDVVEGVEESDLPLIPVLADYFGVPESEITTTGELPYWPGEAGGKVCLCFEDVHGTIRAYPNVTLSRDPENAIHWPPHNLAITVKAKPVMLFTDVQEGDYYANAVAWALKEGITSGVAADRFGVGSPCKREQIATFLWRANGSPEASKTADFADMTNNQVFNKAISWAVEQGITSGAGNNKFGVGQTCTRVQAVTFLWNAAGRPTPEKQAAFSDMTGNPVFNNAISWAVENGITSGTGGNKFSPNKPCTREQIVTFLYKAYK